MPAQKQNFTLVQGDTTPLRIPLFDASGATYTLPNGYTATFWAAPSANTASGSVPLKKTSPTGVTIDNTSATQTVLIVNFAGSDTVSLAPGDYYHETQLTNGTDTHTVATGTMRLVKGLIP